MCIPEEIVALDKKPFIKEEMTFEDNLVCEEVSTGNHKLLIPSVVVYHLETTAKGETFLAEVLHQVYVYRSAAQCDMKMPGS
ncbi:hypothetical protein PR048_021090 [Dryococelus australis]|uniref:Uncharacterized protein n=1 Tax=Dryococelus australis TaxID=614101 RepID=A0ABQ9GX84_9NEOP|nr:hypothetical protein PR048_021090 [Dryococelus australis]